MLLVIQYRKEDRCKDPLETIYSERMLLEDYPKEMLYDFVINLPAHIH